jgi:DNA repair photolyase
MIAHTAPMIEPRPSPPSPAPPHKARGALSNRDGRFERAQRHAVDDGWPADEPPPALRTTLIRDTARTILTRNRSPDIAFDRSINPYRGCEHGCVYCYARPSHAFLGLSPGLDFESRLFYKPDAVALLETELRRARYGCAPIALGTNTDAYQPIERRLGLTRGILALLGACNHPVAIVTKSHLVTRDIDILAPMARRNLVQIRISITTLDAGLARRLEPRAPPPARRLETIRALAAAGIPTGVMAAPMIPGLNDSECEAILAAARNAGATSADYVLLRLPLEIKDLFREWLETHVPARAERVLRLIRETRDGRLYDPRFTQRMRGSGVYAGMLAQRFAGARRRLGLTATALDLDCSRFTPPQRPGDQLSLFP